MPALTHSPADIIRYLLVGLGGGVLPSAGGDWPIYVSQEPTTPDNVITLYNTAGIKDGRLMPTGEVQEHPGVQIRVRATDDNTGWTKAEALAILLDETVLINQVNISTSVYIVYSVSRSPGPLVLGKEVADSKRDLFTINITTSIRQTI